MCGRYASSRQPEDLVEEFEIRNADLPNLEPDFNVAPTKEVYAVVERPPSGDKEATPERQLRALTWGLVPFWAKDPKVGNRMINARMETVAEKPAYRRAFERRRAILPADGYYEWYPTEELTKAGKPRKQPYFIRPKDDGVLAMAGLYEIWRDPAKDEDDPTRFLWTCTVLTTSAEDSLGHIHDRMPLMLSPDRYEQWLDPRTNNTDDLLALLEPAAPGRLEAFPVSTLVSNVKNNGPELVEPLPLDDGPLDHLPEEETGLMPPERMVPTPKGDARVVIRRAKRPLATLVLTHGAGGGIDAPDLVRLARTLPQQDISVVLVEMPWRVAGKKIAPAPPVIDECYTAVLDDMRMRSPLVLGGRSAGARSACRIARGVGCPRRAGAVLPAAPSGPAGEVPSRRAPGAAGCRRSSYRASATRSARRRSSPTASTSPSCRTPTIRLKVPKSAELSQADALAVVLEATLEWVVREISGNRND